MAATFKHPLDSDKGDTTSESQNHHQGQYFGGFQCIKTNGSLGRIVVNGNDVPRKNEDDLTDLSPQLKDVEALLKDYSRVLQKDHSEAEKEEEPDFGGHNSSPILLSEYPEFKDCLSPYNELDCEEAGEVEERDGAGSNDEDEIVFGFKSRHSEDSIERSKEDEDALWELIEAETEALCRSENLLNRCQIEDDLNRSHENSTSIQPPSKEEKLAAASGGLEALMNCAASEMSHLRVGAAILRKPSFGEAPRSLKSSTASTAGLSPSQSSIQNRTVELRDSATSNSSKTLTSLLNIQLAQISRICETVRIEFSNQLAHERALLELLELEHNRVNSEVKSAEHQHGVPPSDLVNQLQHLKERLCQQKALIDDLEYQYLEDKAKYDEEKESLMSQLRLYQDTSLLLGNGDSTPPEQSTFKYSPEYAYIYPGGDGPSEINAAPYSISANDSPVPFKREARNPMEPDLRNDASSANTKASCISNGNSCSASSKKGDFHSHQLFSSIANCNGDACSGNRACLQFSQLPTSKVSAVPITRSVAASTCPSAVFQHQHPQNGDSSDEFYLLHRETMASSPQTSSLPEGLNPQDSNKGTNNVSSNSSLGLNGSKETQHQPSSTSSSNDIFYAVSPLTPCVGMGRDQTQWKRQESLPTQPTNSTEVRYRQRTASAASHRGGWEESEVRPLTRYLPVPEDISFNLRHHLEVTCGHILCSPLLMPHLHVDSTTCAGYLYKVDSRLNSAAGVAERSYENDTRFCDGGDLFPPATRRAKAQQQSQKGTRVTSPSGAAGGFMANLFFHRSKRGKRRWFVLDRRRRILIYYSCHAQKPSSASSLLKPKDVISFTDIIDVYPDRQPTGRSSSFCLLLVASYPPPAAAQSRGPPTRTRTLSLTAPSPETMRVWVDALFTCAGAYLCLPTPPDTTARTQQ